MPPRPPTRLSPLVVKLGIVHIVPGGAPRASGVFGGDDFELYLPGFNEEGNVGPNVQPTQAGIRLPTASQWVIPTTFGSLLLYGNAYPRLAYGGPIKFDGPQVTLTPEFLKYGLHHPVTFSAKLKGYLRDAFVPDPETPTVTIELEGKAMLYVTFKQDTPGSALYDTATIEYCLY